LTGRKTPGYLLTHSFTRLCMIFSSPHVHPALCLFPLVAVDDDDIMLIIIIFIETLYNTQFLIASTDGPEYTVLISPDGRYSE